METYTFFSYKGGAGRSSIAYNTAPLLAKKLNATPDHPLIVVDMDVDSAGMTFLLQSDSDKDERGFYTVNELLSGTVPGSGEDPEEVPLREHDLFKRLRKSGTDFGFDDDMDGAILFVKAQPGENISNSSNYDSGGNPMRRFMRLCRNYKCAGVVLDSPTGDQLTARWSMEVSKKIVCCMRITKQFTLGTFDFFSRKAKDEGEKRVYMVPNAVPQEEIRVGDEIFNVKTIRDFLRDTIQKKGDFGDLTLDTRMVDNEYGGIPEVKRFKIREGILYKLRVQQKQLQPDEEHALECFKMLSEILTEKNGDE